MRIVILFFILLNFVSCSDEKHKNKFSDPVLIKIADLQDRRSSDSLYYYFNDENPVHRKEAVLAFASVQDTLAVSKIGIVLVKDSNAEVRRAAAFTLGQTLSKATTEILQKALLKEKDENVLREIIESCGKVFDKDNLSQVDISSSDTLLQEGLAWAYFRIGLRGIVDSILNIRAATLLDEKQTLQTRLGSTNFFARGAQRIDLFEQQITKAAMHDPSPWVRAAATSALRKIKSSSSLISIGKILATDKDYRVRVNATKALQPFDVKDIKSTLFLALKDSNLNVTIAAAEVVRAKATTNEFKEIVSLARNNANWRTQGILFETALTLSSNKELVEEVMQLYEKTQNPYSKAALLTALGQSPDAWNFVEIQLHKSNAPVIKSSAAAALVSINSNQRFDESLKSKYADVYKKAFSTGDAAVIGTIASALMDTTLGYKRIITDYNFLYEAKSKLSLPKDNEALQPLEAAIAYFEGKEVSPQVKNEFNHPIDWNLVKTIPRDQKVLIQTDKGDIVLRLLVEEAPGSVANFVKLVNSGYFNAKNFHRVVPNFVIQGGCNRGDGWGSEDYSIRSEFSERQYTEGSVGMASAGKDTEGTQWFITHSPTPHLDGRYSIFAVVETGMHVVHQIEVGNNILSIELVK